MGTETRRSRVAWNTCDPVWAETFHFDQLAADQTFTIEVWDLGSSARFDRSRDIRDTTKIRLVRGARFIGSAELPLVNTLSSPGLLHQVPLTRTRGDEHVTGQVELQVQWNVTTASLLQRRVATLEGLLR